MVWMTGILVYVISWWLVFFMLLPVGVKSQIEDGGTAVPGSSEGAPRNPNLGKKVLATSLIAALILGLFIYTGGHELLSFRT